MQRLYSDEVNFNEWYGDVQISNKELMESVSYMRGQRDILASKLLEMKNRLLKVEEDISLREKCVLIVGSWMERLWESAKKLVEEVITYGLKLVFGQSLELKVVSDVAANQSVADMELIADGHPRDIIESEGGSVSDLVSILARWVVLLRSERRRILILDEPFRCVDTGKVDLILKLLVELSETLKTQVIMVSHHEGFMDRDLVKRCYLVEKKAGKTQCLLQW